MRKTKRVDNHRHADVMMVQLFPTRDGGYCGWRHEDAVTNMHHDDEDDSDHGHRDHAGGAVGGEAAWRLSRLPSEEAVMTKS